MREYPCNVVAYYTTRPLLLLLGIPLYYGRCYLPHILIFPLLLIWILLGLVVIIVFGGIALVIGKSDELIGVWF